MKHQNKPHKYRADQNPYDEYDWLNEKETRPPWFWFGLLTVGVWVVVGAVIGAWILL